MFRPQSLHFSSDDNAGAGAEREHRVAPRVSCTLPLTVVAGGEELASEIRDISSGGVAVGLAREVALGEVYFLTFALPGEPEAPIRCAGLVRSFRSDGTSSLVGLEFHKLESEDRRRIADFVHRVRAGSEPAALRPHWGGTADLDGATLFPAGGEGRPVLRWAPGLASLFDEVADHIGSHETIFIPGDHADLSEGDQLFLEVVPPSSHAVFRMLAEVVWVEDMAGSVADVRIVQDEDNGGGSDDEQTVPGGGFGLKLGGLTAMDRYLLRAIRGYLKAEAERYR